MLNYLTVGLRCRFSNETSSVGAVFALAVTGGDGVSTFSGFCAGINLQMSAVVTTARIVMVIDFLFMVLDSNQKPTLCGFTLRI